MNITNLEITDNSTRTNFPRCYLIEGDAEFSTYDGGTSTQHVGLTVLVEGGRETMWFGSPDGEDTLFTFTMVEIADAHFILKAELAKYLEQKQ